MNKKTLKLIEDLLESIREEHEAFFNDPENFIWVCVIHKETNLAFILNRQYHLKNPCVTAYLEDGKLKIYNHERELIHEIVDSWDGWLSDGLIVPIWAEACNPDEFIAYWYDLRN